MGQGVAVEKSLAIGQVAGLETRDATYRQQLNIRRWFLWQASKS